MTATLLGKIDWSGDADEETHRTYKITWLIKTDDVNDGPYTVMNCPNLPTNGSAWQFGNDYDQWAWCRGNKGARRHAPQGGEPGIFWTVDQTFSTKPPSPSKQRCLDTSIEDPLLEPAKVSGAGVKYTEEASFDRFGNMLCNSAFEMFKGPKVEFDNNRGTVKISQNVGSWAQVSAALSMQDRVNGLPIWGAPYRCVKLSNVTWTRQFWQKCIIYFNRELTFDINIKVDDVTGAVSSGFDRQIIDEGTSVLKGRYDATTGEYILININGQPPDPNNPTHFIRYRDPTGEAKTVILNGAGLPAFSPTLGKGFFIAIDPNLNPAGSGPPNSSYWAPFDPNAAITTITNANIGTIWGFGSIVNYTNPNGPPGKYIQVLAGGASLSDYTDPTGLVIPLNGVSAFKGPLTINNAGNYSTGAVGYNRGDYVKPLVSYSPGYRYIQRYNEANFVALGVPVDFTVP